MFTGFAVGLILGAFTVQLLFCFRAESRKVCFLPAALLMLSGAACLAAYAAAVALEHSGKGIYGAAFAAVMYGFVVLAALTGVGAAWLVWAIVRFVQKRRK